MADADADTETDPFVPRGVLVLGGARSGKSAFAERLALASGLPVVYVATARVTDDEMAERIARHRARRPAGWRTLEAADHPAAAAAALQPPPGCVLLEDLGVLLSNLLVAAGLPADSDPAPPTDAAEERVVAEVEALLGLAERVIVVSNEVGMGLVPPYPLGRAFRDALGRINQRVAARVDAVYLLVAGLPLPLKSAPDCASRP